MECISTTSLKHCTCTYTACDKRGNCCACVQYHRGKGEIPGCFFSQHSEKSYDRSLANFLRDCNTKTKQ
ncbi:MAG: DUF6485 family protein [Geobacteraceae bacterium]|nr:DUF6485 family protein [Geobacteraceae bacterium]